VEEVDMTDTVVCDCGCGAEKPDDGLCECGRPIGHD
jgi:hypothetical protein